jgi:hypothetical protein
MLSRSEVIVGDIPWSPAAPPIRPKLLELTASNIKMALLLLKRPIPENSRLLVARHGFAVSETSKAYLQPHRYSLIALRSNPRIWLSPLFPPHCPPMLL